MKCEAPSPCFLVYVNYFIYFMASEDISDCIPILNQLSSSQDKKRSSSSPSPLLIHEPSQQRHAYKSLAGVLIVSENKVFEVVAEKKSKYTLKSADQGFIECTSLELSLGGKYDWFPKSHAFLQYHLKLSLKNSSSAASFLLAKPMLFESKKDKRFIIDYSGERPNLFEFIGAPISSELLSWNNQLIRCCMAAPQIPDDFRGSLILIGILPQEGVVLLGSVNETSSESDSAFLNGSALIFYANSSSKGRGLTLYQAVGRRLQDTKMKSYHYYSANCIGSLPSCFYYDKNSPTQQVAWPLTMHKDSLDLTVETTNPLFCLQLLKEMSGIVLASSPVGTKRKRNSIVVENPLKSPQKATKCFILLTVAERLILMMNKRGVASE